jgi:hypothetical protein
MSIIEHIIVPSIVNPGQFVLNHPGGHSLETNHPIEMFYDRLWHEGHIQHSLAYGYYFEADDGNRTFPLVANLIVRIPDRSDNEPDQTDDGDDEDLNLSPEQREALRKVNESVNLFVMPQPPTDLTIPMAQAELRKLITLDMQFGLETQRVMFWVYQLNPSLGKQMIGWVSKYFRTFQDETQEIIDKLGDTELEQDNDSH